MNINGVADAEVLDLRFLVIGGNPHVSRPDRQHALAWAYAVAGVYRAILKIAADFGTNLGIAELEVGVLELPRGRLLGSPRDAHRRCLIDRLFHSIASGTAPLRPEEVGKCRGLCRILGIECDTDGCQAGGDIGNAGLDAGLLLFQIRGNVERISFIGLQSESRPCLLNGLGGRFDLLFGGGRVSLRESSSDWVAEPLATRLAMRPLVDLGKSEIGLPAALSVANRGFAALPPARRSRSWAALRL